MSTILLLFYFYFIFLILFSLISHPILYCILLVLTSLISSLICYLVYGFSWYSLLFCLVYIGGVYILFIFVSIHSPNSNVVYYWSSNFMLFTFLVFFVCFFGINFYNFSLDTEFSSFLNTSVEGSFYVCMCLTLLFGFFVLSLIMSIKLNYYR